jgi:hypothetical protein
MADLEERLETMAARLPAPGRETTRRAAAVALSTVPAPRAGWRRPARPRPLLAVAALAAVLVLVATPAFGVGGELLDLLPGRGEAPRHPAEGGPPGVEPEKSEIPDVFVSCDAREIRAAFDPAKGAVVAAGESVLGSATYDSGAVSETCRRVPRGSFVPDAVPLRVSYEAVDVVCTAPRGVDIELHPILNGDTGRIFGSNLIVSYGKPARTLFAAVVKPGGARAFYDKKRCSG